MYIQSAEITSIRFLKKRKKMSLSIRYESKENPEDIIGLITVEKAVLIDNEWTVSEISVWNEKNQSFEIITRMYAPSLINQLKRTVFEQLRKSNTA